MPFVKGKQKTGGRAKGTINKANQEIIDLAKAKGKDPVEFMLEVMNDEGQPLNLRLDASKAVAPYVNKKMPTSIENTNMNEIEKLSEDELLQRLKDLG